MPVMSDIWIERQCMHNGRLISPDNPANRPAENQDPTCDAFLFENLRHPMIEPFVNQAVREVKTVRGGEQTSDPVISYGLSGYGYDVRLAPKYRVFTNLYSTIIDPKNLDPKAYADVEGDVLIIPPHSYALGNTIEYFRIPRDIMVICVGKSTYARSGVIINVTPIEPGFEGQVVIEISNATSLPVKVYGNEGIGQFIFLKGDRPCRTSYADKGGKYQGQVGIQMPKV